MIKDFLNNLTKEPNEISLLKARLSIIDWIGYALAGTKTNQAEPFDNLQNILPKGKALNLFGKKKLTYLIAHLLMLQ